MSNIIGGVKVKKNYLPTYKDGIKAHEWGGGAPDFFGQVFMS